MKHLEPIRHPSGESCYSAIRDALSVCGGLLKQTMIIWFLLASVYGVKPDLLIKPDRVTP